MNFVGTVLLAANSNFITFKLIFTETGMTDLPIGPEEPFYLNPSMAGAQRMIAWEELIASNYGKSLVSYDPKDAHLELCGDELQYGRISAVKMKRVASAGTEDIKEQYEIAFNAGLLKSKKFFIPGFALKEIMKLLKETELGSRMALVP